MKIKQILNKSLNMFSYFKRSEKAYGYPEIYNIEATNKCPMTCIMCPRKYMKRGLGDVDMDLYKKIINQLKGYTYKLAFHHFGESLLYPKIDELIKYANEQGIKTELSVNACVINPYLAKKLIDADLSYLHISLDGVDDEMYKKIRGKAANYQKALQYINEIIQYKKDNRKKTYIRIGMINMKLTQDKIDQFRKTWENSGADEVVIKEFTTWEGSADDIKDMGAEYSEQFKENNPYPCVRPWHRMTVLWDGKVVPCCFDYDGKYILGDLTKETLVDIWNGEKMRELRRQHKNLDFKNNELCRNCKERNGMPSNPSYLLSKKFRKRVIQFFKRNKKREGTTQ